MAHQGYGETKPSKFTEDGTEIERTEEWIESLHSEKEKKEDVCYTYMTLTTNRERCIFVYSHSIHKKKALI